MKTIRCAFVDFWNGFKPEQHIPFLCATYEVIIDTKNPDYLFYSCFGSEHLKYLECIKIFWCSENAEPNFNDCDYAISFSEISYGDRTFLFSNYVRGKKDIISPAPADFVNRKFCNFIYTNNYYADPFRVRFFKELSKYKRVDSYGRLLNNMGNKIGFSYETKLEILRQYKFSIAIENSSMAGYTTEKIYDPFLCRSLPLYWGNPHVDSFYNPNAFVNLMAYSSLEEAVEEVIRLDNDDEAYLKMITAPFWLKGNSFEESSKYEQKRLLDFFDHIFSQPKEQAFRRVMYGWQKVNRYSYLNEKTLFQKIVGRIRKITIRNK